MQKLIYATVITSRKLKHYFQAHPIKVKTGFTIADVVRNREAVRQVAKWAIELGQYEITFSSRTMIKGQALANFITEWHETQILPANQNLEYWEMHFDGSLLLSGMGARVLLLTPQKDPLKYVLQMHFRASNNATEYEALLHGLRVAISLDVKRSDFQLIDLDWRTPYIEYLRSGILPENKVKKHQLEIRAQSYLLVEDELYRRRGDNILMKYVSTTDGVQLLEEIHKGICGNHASSKTLVGKAFRQGFYWTTTVDDAHGVVKACLGCLFVARQPHTLAPELQMIPMT